MTWPVERALRDDRIIGLDAAWQLEDWSQPPSRPGRDQWWLGVGTLASATLAAPIYSFTQLAEAGIAWALAAGFTGLGLLGFSRMQKHVARPSPDAEAVVRSLTHAANIDTWGPHTADTLCLPVVVQGGRERRLSQAEVTSTLVRAQRGDTSLRVVVRSIRWPARTSRSCRIVPASWIAAELRGPVSDGRGWKQVERDRDLVRAVVVPGTKGPERWLHASLAGLVGEPPTTVSR